MQMHNNIKCDQNYPVQSTVSSSVFLWSLVNRYHTALYRYTLPDVGHYKALYKFTFFTFTLQGKVQIDQNQKKLTWCSY